MNEPRSLSPPKMLPGKRRHGIKLAYLNGALWGLGNGLGGSSLMFYLANEYKATPSQLSWIIAAPALVGVLRLLTPMWMDRVGNRRRFCTGMFTASALILLGLPLMSAPGVLPDATHSIPALIACWAGYYLLEHFAAVALWSWFGDLVPRPVRGRFVGRRSGWMNCGRVLGIVLSAMVTIWWIKHCQELGSRQDMWMSYAGLVTLAAVVMLAAVLPLLRMVDPPSPSGIGQRKATVRLEELLRPFTDRKFLRLLCYGWWFSFANGITETAVRLFKLNVLHLEFAEKRALDASSRGLQAAAMPWVGAQADRRGNVVVLVIAQGLVAAGLLFLLPATAEARWWILGTYALWIAYAGTNVTMPNLMLQLSDPTCSAAYSGAWFASTQLVYALSALAGGRLYEWMTEHWTTQTWSGLQVDHFAALFVLGWALRSLGIVWALRIRETNAVPLKTLY